MIVVVSNIIKSALMVVPCHRKPERCLHIKGKPMPICSRCFAMLTGYIFIPILFFFHFSFLLGVLFQIPMLIDGYTQRLKWRTSNNFLRVFTGLLSGIGLSISIVAVVRLMV